MIHPETGRNIAFFVFCFMSRFAGMEAFAFSSQGEVGGVAEAVEEVGIVLRGLVLRHE